MKNYRVEYQAPKDGEWTTIYGMGDLPKAYCDGYLDSHRNAPLPRLALRCVRNRDDKVCGEARGGENAALGQTVGFPRWDAYLRAAARALRSAAEVVTLDDVPYADGAAIELDAQADALEAMALWERP